MARCDHCLLEFPEAEAVRENVRGQQKTFCCNGCRGIYLMITSEGLEDFYDKRTSWTPGPSDDRPCDISLFLPFLKQRGDEIELDLVLDGIRCASCVWLNERMLMKTEGVTSARVNYATHRARIRWMPDAVGLDRILSRIRAIGYQPKPLIVREQDEEVRKTSRDLLLRFGTAAFFSSQLMLYSIALYAGYFEGMDRSTMDLLHLIAWLLTTPVLFYSGWPFFKGALHGLMHGVFTMDVLIATGAGSAYFYSVVQMTRGREVYFDTAAMIVTLILLGRFIENSAKQKASEAVNRLLMLSPQEARKVLANGEFETAAVASIVKQDLLAIVPGERIPLDGIVREGSSEVDESMLTGESKPVAKAPGSEVFGGTINLLGSFVYEVTRTGEETVLMQIIRTVEEAQTRQAKLQGVADRVVGVFVPAILVLSLLTFLGWYMAGAGAEKAVMCGISVLVIACPCALGLATPLAILVATTSAASRGILFKGGDVIEKAGRIDHAVFDKTGTVTKARMALAFHRGIGISDTESLVLAASVERCSEHSLAQAFLAAARRHDLRTATEFRAVPGKGACAKIDDEPVMIGSRALAEEDLGASFERLVDEETRQRLEALETSGASIMYLLRSDRLCGVFAVSDEPRHEAAEAVQSLRHMGIRVSLITGDSQKSAAGIAQAVGIGEVSSRVMPVGKAAEIRKMRREGKTVAMIGDGINDAPALVEADVGIAMGRATDIAIESSDVTLLRQDLRLVPDLIALSRKALRVIRQNVFWAFLYNAAALPLAVSGVLHPVVAAGAMALSSVSVVFNSLRLRRW